MEHTALKDLLAGKRRLLMREVATWNVSDASMEEADAVCLYHTAELNIDNAGSLMPFGNANQIVEGMCRGIPIRELGKPVFAGVCGTDPLRLLHPLLRTLKERGVCGVQNFPTVGLADNVFRCNLEAIQLGYRKEVEMLREAQRMGLEIFPFVFNQAEALAVAYLKPAAVICHLGVIPPLPKGVLRTAVVMSYLERIQSISALLKREQKELLFFVYSGADELTRIIEEQMEKGTIDVDGLYLSRCCGERGDRR